MRHPGIARQRGAATLISAVVMLVLMTLVAFFANRDVLHERRAATNQYRSIRAIEAAEAGVEWAIANLNSTRGVTNACATSTRAPDPSLRERYLGPERSAGRAEAFAAATPLCSFVGGAWSCSCPDNGADPVAAACGAPEGCPTFRIGFENLAGDPTLVRVSATGCTGVQAPCVPGAASAADGTATITQALRLVDGLATLPVAALTAGGDVDLGTGAISATNTDPRSGGITIHTGGRIKGLVDRDAIVSLPGTPSGASLVDGDASLGSLSPDQMFMSFFGMTRAQFRALPSTTAVQCAGACDAAVSAAIGAGARVLWVEGDMTLDAEGVYGSPQRPVVLVVNGNARLQGAITIHGLIYFRNGTWGSTGGATVRLHGAVIAENDFTAIGAPRATYDAAVLHELRRASGRFARVPGGWRDF